MRTVYLCLRGVSFCCVSVCSDGQVCFRMTFIICTGVAVFGVVLALALQILSRPTYARMRQERVANAEVEATSETEPLLAAPARDS